jgi:hypothetical protein
MFVQLFFKYLTFEKAWSALYIKAIEEMVRYLAEPRLKNTDLKARIAVQYFLRMMLRAPKSFHIPPDFQPLCVYTLNPL